MNNFKNLINIFRYLNLDTDKDVFLKLHPFQIFVKCNFFNCKHYSPVTFISTALY